ncbi:MAG: NAD-dependent epimerase/dehydratase family protein, partial [Gammaproteobacteria bacterium]|nr:NAD-dependent epimerase/dehydratase family protein [Gammaproteobacteria bacterium]
FVLLLRKKKPSYNVEQFICDLGVQRIPEEAFDDVDTVFHLAGYAHDISTSKDVDGLYYSLNVDATIELATIAAKKNIKRFVFVSSVKAGGSASSGTCISEDDDEEPDGIYGRTKREAELKLLEIGEKYGMHVAILRPALIYGEGMKGNLKTMLEGVDKGWFPPLPDVHNRRSMVYIDDVIRILLSLAEHDQANGHIYILTDGQVYTTRDIYEMMSKALGKTLPRWNLPEIVLKFGARIGDLVCDYSGRNFPLNSHSLEKLFGSSWYCSDKIKRELGYNTTYTFKDALPKIVEQYRNEIRK